MLYSVITLKKEEEGLKATWDTLAKSQAYEDVSHKQKCCPFILFLFQYFCIANSWLSSLGYIYLFFSTLHFSQDMNRFFIKIVISYFYSPKCANQTHTPSIRQTLAKKIHRNNSAVYFKVRCFVDPSLRISAFYSVV